MTPSDRAAVVAHSSHKYMRAQACRKHSNPILTDPKDKEATEEKEREVKTRKEESKNKRENFIEEILHAEYENEKKKSKKRRQSSCFFSSPSNFDFTTCFRFGK